MKNFQIFYCTFACASTFFATSFANFGQYNNEFYLGGKLAINNNKYSLSSTVDAKKSAELQVNLNTLEQEIKQLANEIEEKKQDQKIKEQEIKDYTSLITTAETLLSARNITIGELSQAIQNLQSSLAAVQISKDELRPILEKAKTTRATLQAQSLNIEKEILSKTNDKMLKEAEISKIKLNQMGMGSNSSKSDTSANLGFIAGFQTYKNNFLFGAGLEMDFGSNNIDGELRAKSNFNYSLIGRIGYQFYPDITGYTSLGFKFARYNISSPAFQDDKNVNYLVFGIGMEKRFNRDIGLFTEFNYAKSINGDISLTGLEKNINFSTFQFVIGAKYYFDADSTIQTIKKSLKRSR